MNVLAGSALPPDFHDPLVWSVSLSRFHQDFPSFGFPFQLMPETRMPSGLLIASSPIAHPFEAESAAGFAWNFSSPVGSPPALSTLPYSALSPTFAPPLYQVVAVTDPTGHFQRLRLDDVIFHMAHGPFARLQQDEPTMSPPGNSDQTQGMPTSPGSQIWGMVVTDNSTTQLGPSSIAVSAHVTTLFGSDAGRIERSAGPMQITGPRINQLLETLQDSLSKTISANWGTANTATMATLVDSHAEGGVSTELNAVADGEQEYRPLPHAAGLVADAAPFDQVSLERAIDQFFNQLDELGVGQLVEQESVHVIPLSLALIGTVTAVELARRRLLPITGTGKAARSQDSLGSEELVGFPELPGSWSTRLT
jgi:hypothetical protein